MDSLGISFSGKHIRFVGVNMEGEAVFIKEAEADLDFSEDLSYYSRNSAVINNISEVIKDTLAETGTGTEAVNFSIDTNNAFLNVIPVDFSETPENIKSRILWDLSNYFPDSYKNYRLNYIKLPGADNFDNINNVLLIAVHNNLNLLFQKIFSEAGLGIKLFDIDQLAALHSVNSLEPGVKNKKCILIGCRKNRIDISFARNNNLAAYTYLLYKDVDFESSLRKELIDMSLGAGAADIYVYGEEIAGFASGIAKNAVNDSEVSYIDLYARAAEGLNPDYKKTSYKFAPAYGLALKGLKAG